MSEVFLLWANVRQKVGRGLKDDAIESLGFEERTTASLFESEVIDEDDRGKEETRKNNILQRSKKEMANPLGCLKMEERNNSNMAPPLPNVLIGD